ncbi:MAG TPA: EamA family transporter RarD [Micromonosporaceae bacterium]
MSQLRRGYVYGLAAYVAWGFFPIYFKLLRPAGPVEILAHRVLWSVVFVAALLTVVRRWRDLTALVRRPRTLAGIATAAAFIGVNWGTYIYGVNSSHVVETSLGYFINPLISVAFGVLLLGERLRPAQVAALAIGTGAVAVLTVDYGRPPYIALVLALSFALYGLTKKRLGVPPAEGLLVESGVLALPALGYLVWLSYAGKATFGHVSVAHTVLVVLSGAVTALPLLAFAGAANRIPMTGLGVLQYAAPILQLFCGVVLYHEPMPAARLVGFALVWIALVVFTWDALRHARRSARVAPVLGPTSAPAATPRAVDTEPVG